MKRKIRFGRILLIYVAIWIVAIISISAKMWNSFSEYQNQYTSALESVNPDRIMDEQIKAYQSENIRAVASSFINEVNEYETSENIQAALDEIVIGKKITYERDENFTNRKPLYAIKADDQIIGYVSMKQENESDRFGFHRAVIDEMKLDTYHIPLYNVTITMPEIAQVEVNQIPIAESYQIENTQSVSFINKKAIEITGNENKLKSYKMEGFLQYPLIDVKIGETKLVIDNVEPGVYQVAYPIDQDLANEVISTVLEAGKKYVLNANQMLSFNEVAKYLKNGSEAYQNVLSVQSGLTWAGKPDQLEILDSQLLEIHQYSDNIFTAKTYYKIHRLYREVSYEEEMVYEWLLENDNNTWLINNFSLVK